MKKLFKIYIPWVLFMVVPALFCLFMYITQLLSAENFAADWDAGFFSGLYDLASAGRTVFLCLSGVAISLLSILRPFGNKLGQKQQWFQWSAGGVLLFYALCVLLGDVFGALVAANTSLIGDVLHILVPAAAAFLLLKREQLSLAKQWIIAAAVAAITLANCVYTLYVVVEDLRDYADVAMGTYVAGMILIAYGTVFPAFFALAPRLLKEHTKGDAHGNV